MTCERCRKPVRTLPYSVRSSEGDTRPVQANLCASCVTEVSKGRALIDYTPARPMLSGFSAMLRPYAAHEVL